MEKDELKINRYSFIVMIFIAMIVGAIMGYIGHEQKFPITNPQVKTIDYSALTHICNDTFVQVVGEQGLFAKCITTNSSIIYTFAQSDQIIKYTSANASHLMRKE